MEIAILIICLGLLFDYTNGFHDAANVVSTVIATRVLAPFSAIVLAGVLNTLGATQISGVAQTIATGLIDAQDATQALILCALFGAIVWNFITWYFGMPSSSSYALIGGLLGAAIAAGAGVDIYWRTVTIKVLLPMILSPFLGFLLGYLGMRALYLFPASHNLKLFRHLQIGSACLVALSHGLNDAQKSMGIITLGLFSSHLIPTPHIPLWVILACAFVMGAGTLSGGFRIIRTMGFSITRLTPVQGFAAECSASLVILTASFLGMPISSSHMIAGSITGVGTANGRDNVRWTTPQKIALAWFLTLPGAGLLGALAFRLSS